MFWTWSLLPLSRATCQAACCAQVAAGEKKCIFALRLGKREIVFRFVGSKPNVIPPWSRDKEMVRYGSIRPSPTSKPSP